MIEYNGNSKSLNILKKLYEIYKYILYAFEKGYFKYLSTLSY